MKNNCNEALDDLFKVIKKYLEIRDWEALTIILACAAAHCIEGEMLWVRLYGGSRSGKTELLRAISEHTDSAKLEVITPAAIKGGLKGGHRLLERLDGKLVVTKDLASMLCAKAALRNELFGLLRNVKDGELVSDFGTVEGYTPQKSSFDWIIGTTPVFAQYKQLEDLLGSRYIDINWHAADRWKMTSRALVNDETLNSIIRPSIQEATHTLIDRAKEAQGEQPIVLDETMHDLIVDWADLTALLRSPVARDKQHRVKFHPEPEVGTSLAQNLARIAKGLKLLGISDTAPYLARLCVDSIPQSRRMTVKNLLGSDGFSPEQYDLEDMQLLGICNKPNGKYSLKSELGNRINHFVAHWR